MVWQKLDRRRQQACLTEVVQQVVYDQTDESVSFTLRDDWDRFSEAWFAENRSPTIQPSRESHS